LKDLLTVSGVSHVVALRNEVGHPKAKTLIKWRSVVVLPELEVVFGEHATPREDAKCGNLSAKVAQTIFDAQRATTHGTRPRGAAEVLAVLVCPVELAKKL
jgi:hypothetical protein